MENYELNPLAPDWAPGLGAPTDFCAANLRSKFVMSTDSFANGLSYPFPPRAQEGLSPAQNFLQRNAAQDVQEHPAINPRSIDHNSTVMWHRRIEESKWMYYHYSWYMHNLCHHQMHPRLSSVMCPREYPYIRGLIDQSKCNIIPPTVPTNTVVHKNSYTDLLLAPTKPPNSARNTMTKGHRSFHRSACILCGYASHCYSDCPLFDGKNIYFKSAMNGRTYAMQSDSSKDGPTLRDMYFFIYTAMHLGPDQILLCVGSDAPIHVENYAPEVRCCDVHIFPGVVVDVSPRFGGITPISRRAAQIALAPMLSAHHASSDSCVAECVDPARCRVSTHSKGKSCPLDESDHPSHTEKGEHEELRTVPAEAMNVSTITPASTSLIHSVPAPDLGNRDASRASTVLSTSDAWTNEVYNETPLNQSGGTAPPATLQKTVKDKKDSLNSLQSVVDTSEDAGAACHSYSPKTPNRLNYTEVQVPTQISVLCPMKSRVEGEHSQSTETFLDLAKETVKKENCNHTPELVKLKEEEEKEEVKDGVYKVKGEEMTMTESEEDEEEEEEEEEEEDDEKRRLRTVHIKFFPVSMSFLQIRKMLWACGVVHKVRLVKPQATTNPERMFYVCFVEFATIEGFLNAMNLNGHRVAVMFRLAVERSQQPIRGGYVTDRDAATGKPCTFGLCESERRKVEERYLPFTAAGECEEANDNHSVKQEGDTRQRRHRRRRRPSALCGDAAAGSGAYALRIVSTLRAAQSRSAPQAEPQSPAPRARSRTAPATAERAEAEAKAVPPPAPVDMMVLREQLRRVANAHIREPTHLTFYAAVSAMEDLKWASALASFRLAIARCEAALYLYRARPGDAESATRAAADAVRLGSELSARMAAAVAERSGGGELRESGAAAWGAHFTALPLALQRPDGGGGAAAKGPRGEGAPYPSGEAVLQFAQVLFHMALLFDDFLLRYEKDMGAAAARPDPAAAEKTTDALNGAERELLACARRLLTQLLAEIDGEKDANTCSALVLWRHRISLALPHLPRGDGWRPGHLMSAIAPGIRDLSAVTLATCSDIFFL